MLASDPHRAEQPCGQGPADVPLDIVADHHGLLRPRVDEPERARERGRIGLRDSQLLRDADRVQLGLQPEQLDLAPLHPRRPVRQQRRPHARAPQRAQQLHGMLHEPRTLELVVAQPVRCCEQRLARLTPRRTRRGQVRAAVGRDVPFAGEHARVEHVALRSKAIAERGVVRLGQLLAHRRAQRHQCLGLDPACVVQRVVEVEDDGRWQRHCQRSPGVFFGYSPTGIARSSAVRRIRFCSAVCAAG